MFPLPGGSSSGSISVSDRWTEQSLLSGGDRGVGWGDLLQPGSLRPPWLLGLGTHHDVPELTPCYLLEEVTICSSSSASVCRSPAPLSGWCWYFSVFGTFKFWFLNIYLFINLLREEIHVCVEPQTNLSYDEAVKESPGVAVSPTGGAGWPITSRTWVWTPRRRIDQKCVVSIIRETLVHQFVSDYSKKSFLEKSVKL